MDKGTLERFDNTFTGDFCNDGEYTPEQMNECLARVIKRNHERFREFLIDEMKVIKQRRKI